MTGFVVQGHIYLYKILRSTTIFNTDDANDDNNSNNNKCLLRTKSGY